MYERLLHACDRHLGKVDPRSVQIAFETVQLQIKTGKIVICELRIYNNNVCTVIVAISLSNSGFQYDF